MKKSLALAKWVKSNFLKNPRQTFLSIFLICLISFFLEKILFWLFLDSVWLGDAATCREASGACLSFIREKFDFIMRCGDHEVTNALSIFLEDVRKIRGTL